MCVALCLSGAPDLPVQKHCEERSCSQQQSILFVGTGGVCGTPAKACFYRNAMACRETSQHFTTAYLPFFTCYCGTIVSHAPDATCVWRLLAGNCGLARPPPRARAHVMRATHQLTLSRLWGPACEQAVEVDSTSSEESDDSLGSTTSSSSESGRSCYWLCNLPKGGCCAVGALTRNCAVGIHPCRYVCVGHSSAVCMRVPQPIICKLAANCKTYNAHRRPAPCRLNPSEEVRQG